MTTKKQTKLRGDGIETRIYRHQTQFRYKKRQPCKAGAYEISGGDGGGRLSQNGFKIAKYAIILKKRYLIVFKHVLQRLIFMDQTNKLSIMLFYLL